MIAKQQEAPLANALYLSPMFLLQSLIEVEEVMVNFSRDLGIENSAFIHILFSESYGF